MSENLKILKMVEEGKISADDAAKLLAAIEDSSETITISKSKGKTKWLRVRITDIGGKTKVNVNVPVTLIDAGMKMGLAYDENLFEKLGDVDIEGILDAVRNGAEGNLVDIETEEGEKDKIFVD